MFNPLIDDVVIRAEQSRVSYNLQTEEFRHLNANLQTYLGDIKTIDDENRQLQETIDQIRTKYISTLEHHLTRLPDDFREQSQTLTHAHLERYRLKSRTRRCLAEREEWKRRIQFLTINEKDQTKYLTNLQRQERANQKEFQKLNEQFQRLGKYVANEKEIHRQAMTKVDDLHIQLEHIWIDRSKTEFQIQTLKEEVQLMQTTKEFLSEERETILSTRDEANEYFLSRLNDSITRIREDFDQLNQTQIQQIEQDYQQMLQTMEENLLANQTTVTSQQTIPSEYERLQHEHQTVYEELTTLNDQNQMLAQHVLAMESDFYTLRNERMQQLISKDQELEYSQRELQILNEKLTHLAEYDRNLKFELTLYRGVLESEYRRKQIASNQQQQQQQSQLIRPTTLRAHTQNSNTDRRTWLTSGTKRNKWNDQQQEEVSNTPDPVQIDDDDLLGGETDVQNDDIIETKSPVNREKLLSGESLWRQLIEPFNQAQQTERTSTNVSSQDDEQPSRSSSTTASAERLWTSPFEVQQASSVRAETKQPLTSSASPIHQDDQPASSPQQYQTSSRTSTVSAEALSEVQRSRNSSITTTAAKEQLTSSQTPRSPSTSSQEHQPSSHTSSTSSKTAFDLQRPLISTATPIVPDDQPLMSTVQQFAPSQEDLPSSRTSSISSKTSAELEKSPISFFTAAPEHHSPTSDAQQPPPQEDQRSSRTSSVGSKTSVDSEKSSIPFFTTAPEHHSPIFDVQQLPLQEDQRSSRSSSDSSKASTNVQKSPLSATTPIAPEHESSMFDIRLSPSPLPQEDRQSSRTSSTSSNPSSDIQKSPFSAPDPTVSEQKLSTYNVLELLLTTPSEDLQTSSTAAADKPEKTSSVITDDYQITISTDDFIDENQGINSFIETDENVQYEDSTSYTTDEKALSEVDHHEDRQSCPSIKPSSVADLERLAPNKSTESGSSSITLTNAPQEPESDQLQREEDINSSLKNSTEENHSTNNISSEITGDHNLDESTLLLLPETSKQSSVDTSFTDVEEVDSSTSPKLERKLNDKDDPNLVMIMQDLRYVFHELANEDELIEINHELPDQILDRLECRDHFIRTLFNSLIRKYLVQPAVQAARSNTLDWLEFRDILFPIITGRYTERHIRKLFDLFDTSQDGYLSLQEIAELLEVLHANDTIDLAQTIIDEFDTDHDGKLNVDELIEAIKNHDDINDQALSEETENKEWFNQSPNDTQTIILEVPIGNFSSKNDAGLVEGISLLGRIFQRVGANVDSKQLDSRKENLSLQITNEFINNNINISSEDLYLFIQSYLDQKGDNDSLINWSEFRDLFFPIINHGLYSQNDLRRWFELFDTNENGIITREQTIRILRLLQIQNIEDIFTQLDEITDDIDSCTFDELNFLLDSTDESISRLLPNTDQITAFDNDWLSKTIF